MSVGVDGGFVAVVAVRGGGDGDVAVVGDFGDAGVVGDVAAVGCS